MRSRRSLETSRADALDALLDLRMRALEAAAFEWIAQDVSDRSTGGAALRH
jgi:hypothetical protein